jgi:hypothetical protein
MVTKFHQGEKLYLDNLYIEYTFVEQNDAVNFMEINGGVWKKFHPFYPEIDRNNIVHIFRKNEWKEETNTYDDRNADKKEINFRV